jgi:hypothetical protein
MIGFQSIALLSLRQNVSCKFMTYSLPPSGDSDDDDSLQPTFYSSLLEPIIFESKSTTFDIHPQQLCYRPWPLSQRYGWL